MGVPSGMRQKSAVQDGGVASLLRSSEDAMICYRRYKKGARVKVDVWLHPCFDVARDGAGVTCRPEVAPFHCAGTQDMIIMTKRGAV